MKGVTVPTARDRIRRDAELFKWSRQDVRHNTELYLRGSRALEIEYRRDGSVERAQWYPDFRGKYCEYTPAKRKKETVLAWLAE